MSSVTTVMWFRRYLRLSDNPALLDAAAGGRVLGLFVLDPLLWERSGAPRREQLAASLHSLSASMGGRLVVRRGDPVAVVRQVAEEVGAVSVHVSADYAPYGQRRDREVEASLKCPLVRTGSPYAVAPGRVLNQQGRPYQVFTPYFKAWLAHGWRQPVDAPARVQWVTIRGQDLPRSSAVAGEQAALERWRAYDVAAYDEDRDRPDLDSTSRMSVPLKYGEIHPRTMLADLIGERGPDRPGVEVRPGRRVRTALDPGTAAPRRQGRTRALEARCHRLPVPGRRPRRGPPGGVAQVRGRSALTDTRLQHL